MCESNGSTSENFDHVYGLANRLLFYKVFRHEYKFGTGVLPILQGRRVELWTTLIGINYQLYPIVFGLVYKIRFISPLYVRALLRLPIFRVKQGSIATGAAAAPQYQH